MGFRDLFLCITIVLCATSATANSIHGCGGFVEATRSVVKARKTADAKLDYSHITVELRTIDGLVKDRTHCAPNGYYFIPVYDKGSYIIKAKGPDGWSWDPDNVPVVIDQNGCNANADINFRLTGFIISGRVKGAIGGGSCSSIDGGPSNVKVELLSPSEDLISSFLTSDVGTYSFSNIIPGNYRLRASHPDIEVEVKGSSEVELGFGNTVVDDIFFVSGYDVQGLVVAQGNPVLGVHIYLYSDDVSEVRCPQGSGNGPRQKSALCHAVSDADGKFIFRSIPCGIYELLPYYKGENTVFDVTPPSITVSVKHCHVTVEQKFQVTGFSVGGRVVDDNGDGVDSVKITVDGHMRAITDSQGYYKLDQVTSKNYSIIAEKDHYKFESLENFLVLPNMASIPDIKAVSYAICGVVQLDSLDYKAKVALTHGPENVKPQVKKIDENGSFCFEVPPGEYRLSALAEESESSAELLFSPPFVDLRVNSPLLNIEFFQTQVNIHGTVLCKDNCSPTVSISLTRSVGKGSGQKKTIVLGHDSNDFMFPKVFPGKYQLEVRHQSSSMGSEDDNWCWVQRVIDLDVSTEDKTGIAFVHKGFWIPIYSTHDVDAHLLQPDSSSVDLTIKKGSQKICVESPGLHELYFVNSCIFFGSSSLKFDTLDSSPIYLTGKKYLTRGEIHIDSILHSEAFELSKHIVVDVLSKDHALVDTIQTTLLSNLSDQSGPSVHEYSFWSELGESLTFVPWDSRNIEGNKLLFYPRQRHVSITTDGCQATISPIVGRIGLYIKGSVSPALCGVNIKILAAGDSSNAPLAKGELAVETVTAEDGSFLSGPLYDDTDYVAEASKPGYHLKPLGPYTFSCQKLSQILVHIFDGEEEAKELVPPVLLSLSGEDGYRNNSISGHGGFFVFDNLFPGSFYLRPLLKEYSFSPAAEAIELGSGESVEVIFRSTRVAYSALGTVSLLSGQPKEGVYIEARSESKGYYEETTTDHLGNYRLRGLLPDTTYSIRVVAKGDHGLGIERASPESVDIEVRSNDTRGLDFVVFEQPELTILSGHVDGIDLEELQPHLVVEVRLASDPSNIESAFPLPLSNYFESRDLPKCKHLVQLVSRQGSTTHRFQSDSLEVDLEKQPQIHVGPIKYRVEEYHQKQELTPAPVFPLIVAVSVIALFISMPRLKDLYQLAVGMSPLGSSPATSRKEARKPVLRKRVY